MPRSASTKNQYIGPERACIGAAAGGSGILVARPPAGRISDRSADFLPARTTRTIGEPTLGGRPVMSGLVRAATRLRLVRAVLDRPATSRYAIGAGVATATGLLVLGIVIAVLPSARPVTAPVAAA